MAVIRRPSRRVATLAALAALVVVALLWLLRPEVIDVDAGVVRRGPMRVTVDEEGRTRVRDRFVIAAPVAGRVQRIVLEEGDVVARGQVMARIAPLPIDETAKQRALAALAAAQASAREARTQLANARIGEANAERVAVRREALFEIGGISQEQRDSATLARESARHGRQAAEAHTRAADADVRSARAALLAVTAGVRAAVEVRSPADGTVLRVPEPSERVVQAGTTLLELGDPTRIEVVTDVLSAEAVRVRVGDEVHITDWGGDRALAGRVDAIEPSAFTRVSALGVDEQRVNVIVSLIDRPSTLRDGFRVETRITVWRGDDVVIAPASALFQRGSGWAVFRVEGGRARLRLVGIDHRTSADVEVTRGLAPGDIVVLFPSDELSDRTRVRTRGR